VPRSKIAANNVRNKKTFKKRITVKLVITAGPTGTAIPDQYKNNTTISN